MVVLFLMDWLSMYLQGKHIEAQQTLVSIDTRDRSFAGYFSARMYKVLKGTQWFRNALVVSLSKLELW